MDAHHGSLGHDHHWADSCGAGRPRQWYVLFCAGVFSKGVAKSREQLIILKALNVLLLMNKFSYRVHLVKSQMKSVCVECATLYSSKI